MATSYNRRINLYINGKEIRNDIASIRGEMQHLINAQARMVVGSKEYNAAASEIRKLKTIMQQHQADLQTTKKGWLSLSKVADKFNKYQSLFLGFVGSFAGIALSVKSAVTAYAEFEDKLADVMKTTGLSRDQVGALNDELKKIDTRTSQQDLLDLARVAGKLGISAQKDILEFVRAADKIRVALSEDLGGDVEESINQIGKLVDIFKLQPKFGIEQSMLKVGSAINSLGAAGTANEAYMVEFAKRVAGIAPSAGISIESILGLGATLDELGQTSEVAGTVFNQVISGMFKDTETYAKTAGMSVKDFSDLMNTDANEAFIKVLEGANSSGKGFGELAKSLDKLGLDGARATGVLGVLANNTAKLREKQAFSNQEFEKGTSLLTEFNVKNNTAQAQLDKAKKKFTEISVELGQKLTPAFTAVISKARLMVELVSALTSILTKYGGVILTAAASVVTYTVATKIATMWEERHNVEKGIGLTLSKLSVFWNRAASSAMLLYSAATAALAGNFKRAATAMQLFYAFSKANPIGLVLGAITAVIGAIVLLTKKFNEATAAQKALTDVEIAAQQSIVEEKQKVYELLRIAQSNNESIETRKKALAELNKISPQYFGNLTTETVKTGEAKKAADDYTNSLLKNAKVIAAREKMVEIEKEWIDAELSGENKKLNFWQKAKASFGQGKNYLAIQQRQAAIEAENATKAQQKYNDQVKALYDIINKNQDSSNPVKTIVEPPENGTNTISTDSDKNNKTIADTQKVFELSYQQQLLTLKQFYVNRENLQKEYEARSLALQIAYLQAQEALASDESKKVEIQQQLIDAQGKYRVALKEAIPEIIKNEKAGNSLNTRLLEEDKLMQRVASNQAQATAGMDELTAKQQQNAEMIGMLGATISDYVGNAMSGALDQYATFGDTLVLMALQILKQMAPIWAAQIIGGSLATPQSILSGGIAGVAQFTAMLAIMNGAIAIAEGAVKKKIERKREKAEGYAEGGYTGPGDKDEPAGTVHRGEYVIPASMVGNRYLSPLIEQLEWARRHPNEINPDLVHGRVSLKSGGFVSNPTKPVTTPVKSPEVKPETSAGISEEQLRELTAAINRLTEWKPKVYTELIKKDPDSLDRINKNPKLCQVMLLIF